MVSKKIVENEFYLCCKGGDPRIYANSIFPAYVPEKNKIITLWSRYLLKSRDKVYKNI
jgi:hypothetical protein